MTKKELYHLLRAGGVPEKVFNWSYTKDLDNRYLSKNLTPMLDDIDTFLNNRNSFILYFESDALLASRVAVTFMKAALIAGFYRTFYTVPQTLVGYKLESWNNGEAYNDLLNADFLVLDKILPVKRAEKFPYEVFEEFLEDRLLKNKSTIYVCWDNPNTIFPPRIKALFASAEAEKIITMNGTRNVAQ